MNINVIIVLCFVLVACLIVAAYTCSSEGWFPTSTYINSPINYGVYPFRQYNYRYPYLAGVGRNPAAPIPRGNPVPINSIRWRGMGGPMLTSIKSPKDYYLGQWVYAGTAYTDNPNDFTNVSVYQLNLDPGRDMFRYSVRTKYGQNIPINLPPYTDRLEDGDRFKIPGMEGKGDFIFNEADKYQYVYV